MIDGQHHGVSPQHLQKYADEAAWKEDHRRLDNGALAHRTLELALNQQRSKFWTGYWHRRGMRTSTDTYGHTISSLLQKRKEIMEEMAVARERMGLMANDIEAIDRILSRLNRRVPPRCSVRASISDFFQGAGSGVGIRLLLHFGR
jgi:chorismate mutase